MVGALASVDAFTIARLGTFRATALADTGPTHTVAGGRAAATVCDAGVQVDAGISALGRAQGAAAAAVHTRFAGLTCLEASAAVERVARQVGTDLATRDLTPHAEGHALTLEALFTRRTRRDAVATVPRVDIGVHALSVTRALWRSTDRLPLTAPGATGLARSTRVVALPAMFGIAIGIDTPRGAQRLFCTANRPALAGDALLVRFTGMTACSAVLDARRRIRARPCAHRRELGTARWVRVEFLAAARSERQQRSHTNGADRFEQSSSTYSALPAHATVGRAPARATGARSGLRGRGPKSSSLDGVLASRLSSRKSSDSNCSCLRISRVNASASGSGPSR